MGTYIVGGILLVIVGAIISNMIKKKKNGQTSCGCGCSGCPSAGMCHSKKN